MTLSIKDFEGMTIREAAEGLECSEDAARHSAYANGVSLKSLFDLTWEDHIADMPLSEAVQYLSDLVRTYESLYVENLSHPEYGMTRGEWGCFCAIRSSKSQGISKERLLTLIELNSPTLNASFTDRLVNVYVCNIRKKLPPEIGRIETIWGWGFRFIEVTP